MADLVTGEPWWLVTFWYWADWRDSTWARFVKFSVVLFSSPRVRVVVFLIIRVTILRAPFSPRFEVLVDSIEEPIIASCLVSRVNQLKCKRDMSGEFFISELFVFRFCINVTSCAGKMLFDIELITGYVLEIDLRGYKTLRSLRDWIIMLKLAMRMMIKIKIKMIPVLIFFTLLSICLLRSFTIQTWPFKGQNAWARSRSAYVSISCYLFCHKKRMCLLFICQIFKFVFIIFFEKFIWKIFYLI